MAQVRKSQRDPWRPAAGKALLLNTKTGRPFDCPIGHLKLYDDDLKNGQAIRIDTPNGLEVAKEILRQRGMAIPEFELNGKGNAVKTTAAAKKTSTVNPPKADEAPPKPPRVTVNAKAKDVKQEKQKAGK